MYDKFNNMWQGPLVMEPNEIAQSQIDLIKINKDYLLDPKDDRFWREGNHVPDEGLLEWLKDPESVEKAMNYHLRMSIKDKTMKTLRRVGEVAHRKLIESGQIKDVHNQMAYLREITKNHPIYKNEREKESLLETKEDSVVTSSSGISKEKQSSGKEKSNTFIFFMTDPNCPNCEAQAKILKEFSDKVIVLQALPVDPARDNEYLKGNTIPRDFKKYEGLPDPQLLKKKSRVEWFGSEFKTALKLPFIVVANYRKEGQKPRTSEFEGLVTSEEIVSAIKGVESAD
ncbi:hypothetical protein [Halobacteriovorax sp. CON-3]|uniref:hypothetical protein n=1 Tax=Halobacteriovorax sp. CON-3 TaxID=3157710 RepID=UPI003712048B